MMSFISEVCRVFYIIYTYPVPNIVIYSMARTERLLITTLLKKPAERHNKEVDDLASGKRRVICWFRRSATKLYSTAEKGSDLLDRTDGNICFE